LKIVASALKSTTVNSSLRQCPTENEKPCQILKHEKYDKKMTKRNYSDFEQIFKTCHMWERQLKTLNNLVRSITFNL
jgi:hypothetical protein